MSIPYYKIKKVNKFFYIDLNLLDLNKNSFTALIYDNINLCYRKLFIDSKDIS